jgi:ABC-type multidrug transport system ATPase subunit
VAHSGTGQYHGRRIEGSARPSSEVADSGSHVHKSRSSFVRGAQRPGGPLRGRRACATAASPEIIKDASFALDPGTFTFLTGPSGAGKTSLLS